MAQPHPDTAATPPATESATESDAADAAEFTWFDAALIVLAVVVVGAAGWLSFDALKGLGARVGWDGVEQYLLPLCIDVQAAAGTLGWVHPTVAADTRATARRMTIIAVALSVLGNAVEHVITSWTTAAHGWEILLVVLVGALPVLAMALTLHLVSQLLVNRSRAKADVARAKADVARAERAAAEEEKRKPKGKRTRTQPPPTAPPPPVKPPADTDRAPDNPDAPPPPDADKRTEDKRTDDGAADPWLTVDPAVAAAGEKIAIGERLNRLIDHLTKHGVPIQSLSGKQLATTLEQVYGISCSEQRGRQVLSPRKQAAAGAAADQPWEEVNSTP